MSYFAANNEPWMEQSKCGNDPLIRDLLFHKDDNGKPAPIDFFYDKKYESQAKEYCLGCGVRELCLTYAMQKVSVDTGVTMTDIEWGVWGATNHHSRATRKTKQLKKIQQQIEQMQKLFPASDNPIAS